MDSTTFAIGFEADRTVFRQGAREVFSLPLSPGRLAHRHWPQDPPRADQVERAIDDVEAAIDQAHLKHAERNDLLVGESLQRLLPGLLRRGARVDRDVLEAFFTRWVAASSGSRAATGLGLSGEAAAALLLLREVMHHLGFSGLVTPD